MKLRKIDDSYFISKFDFTRFYKSLIKKVDLKSESG